EPETPAAGGKTVHGRDHRGFELDERRGGHLQPGRSLTEITGKRLALRCERGYVTTRAEITPFTAEDDDTYVRFGVTAKHGGVQRLQERDIHPVGRLRPVQPESGDAVLDV